MGKGTGPLYHMFAYKGHLRLFFKNELKVDHLRGSLLLLLASVCFSAFRLPDGFCPSCSQGK